MTPTPKQTAFLLLKDTLEVLYGGAAGGAKSWALLADAARDVDDVPTQALILRKRFKDLTQPGGLFDVSNQWFRGTKASWDGNSYTWRFPSGASIVFGYLDNETDHLQYQGGGYHIVAFDELTQIRENQYLYLFSRIRRPEGFPIKPRVRAATNPGGPGHEWVRKRWNLPHGPVDNAERKFVSSKLIDNPHLVRADYEEALKRLIIVNEDGSVSDVTYQQLSEGDWTAKGTGGFFDPEKFIEIDWGDVPPIHTFRNILRYWDFGGGGVTDDNPDPDWTAGVKLGVNYMRTQTPGLPDWYVFDSRETRSEPGMANEFIKSVATLDGIGIPQWVEQERGAAGKKEVWYWKNERLPGHMVRGLYVTGTKEANAKIPANMCNAGRIFLVRGDWDVAGFKAECGAFPTGDHDDRVDGLSKGFLALDREEVLMQNMQRGRQLGREKKLVSSHKKPKPQPHYGW